MRSVRGFRTLVLAIALPLAPAACLPDDRIGSGGGSGGSTSAGSGGSTSAGSGGSTSAGSGGSTSAGSGGAAPVGTGGGTVAGSGGRAASGSGGSTSVGSGGMTAAGSGGGRGSGGMTATGSGGGRGGTGGRVGSGGASGSGGATGTGGATGVGGSTGAGGASAGCGMTGAPTGVMSTQSITIADTARSYVLSVPTAYSSSTRYPLVFGWHGLGGNGAQARQYFRVESSSGGQAIFVYPTALPNADGDNAWDLGAAGVDVQLFDALVADVSGKYCIDPNRIFSTGHSYGGFMTNRLGCTRGNVLRAIAPVAGGPPFGAGSGGTCMGAVGAWMTHGSNDPTVDFSQGEAARDRVRMANGCATTTMPVDPTPCVAYDGCMPDLPLHWCVHTDMHNWPSFAGSGIWSFLNSFR